MSKSSKRNLIVYAIDRLYLPHLATALMSFLDHHNPSEFIIGLIYSGIQQNDLAKFVDFFASQGLEIQAHQVCNQFTAIEVGYHFNQVIFYRLLAPELFSEYNRLLYIDSDILFISSIQHIFDLDMQDITLAAVDKSPLTGIPCYFTDILSRYFASGFLLINTDRFITSKVKQHCIDFLGKHHYEMPDQDALNFVVRDFMAIDPCYSVETSFLESSEPLFSFATNPKIIQFSGTSKPWHRNDRHPYKKLYWRYRNKTPYRSLLPDHLGLRTSLGMLLPEDIKKLIRPFYQRN
jgi:lipopolysaccharide biosynthesis glycosyltransferase